MFSGLEYTHFNLKLVSVHGICSHISGNMCLLRNALYFLPAFDHIKTRKSTLRNVTCSSPEGSALRLVRVKGDSTEHIFLRDLCALEFIQSNIIIGKLF